MSDFWKKLCGCCGSNDEKQEHLLGENSDSPKNERERKIAEQYLIEWNLNKTTTDNQQYIDALSNAGYGTMKTWKNLNEDFLINKLNFHNEDAQELLRHIMSQECRKLIGDYNITQSVGDNELIKPNNNDHSHNHDFTHQDTDLMDEEDESEDEHDHNHHHSHDHNHDDHNNNHTHNHDDDLGLPQTSDGVIVEDTGNLNEMEKYMEKLRKESHIDDDFTSPDLQKELDNHLNNDESDELHTDNIDTKQMDLDESGDLGTDDDYSDN